MNSDQVLIIVILLITMAMFVWNYWRYDIVAGFALLSATFVGVVPVDHAFSGFSHPAVITVACVLVISQALQTSGLVDVFMRYLAYTRKNFITQLAANTGITAFLSSFMNNVGAVALMLPVSIRDARKAKRPASQLLMPLSFASLLGGLATLIGTPPNIVIATFRQNNTGEPFSMFDFTPVGLTTAIVGLLFIVFFGWRFLPKNSLDHDGSLESQKRFARYITEFRLPKTSTLIDTSVGDLEKQCDNEIAVLGILRDGRQQLAPSARVRLRSGDTLIVEGDSESLQPLLEDGSKVEAGTEPVDNAVLSSMDTRVIEAVVMPNSILEGLAMREVQLHRKFGINLLGVAREGKPSRARLQNVRFKVGDVLLLQGDFEALMLACQNFGCLALKNRGQEFTPKRGALLTPLIFAIGIIAAAIKVVPIQIAFTAVVGALVVLKLVSLREAYKSIEWPIIVLLGFLIPVGEALQTTGSTDLIASGLSSLGGDLPSWALIAIIVIVSMLLSDVIHNTPTAVLMAPIAFSLALSLGRPTDAYLMAVAVGAASPYLTPIGHQSNTLVMGPGGYRFGDYWRLGLPLDIVILCTAVPLIMLVWH